MENIIKHLKNIKMEIKAVEKEIKQKERELNNELKKLRNVEKKKKKRLSGFALPVKISKELCNFMEREEGSSVARTEVTRYIIDYIKRNKLEEENNRQKINADAALETLLGTKELTYFNIQGYMNKHFR